MLQHRPQQPQEMTERSLDELLDPVSLEARLVEARTRRAEAIARRAGNEGSGPSPPGRRPPPVREMSAGAMGRSADAGDPRVGRSSSPLLADFAPAIGDRLAPSSLPSAGLVSHGRELRQWLSPRGVAPPPRGPETGQAVLPWPQRHPGAIVLLLGFAVGVFGASAALVTAPLSLWEWSAGYLDPPASAAPDRPASTSPVDVATAGALAEGALSPQASSWPDRIVQENPAAIPTDVALPGPLPKVRVPSVARDVGVSLGEFQRDSVGLLEAGLPAIAAIPTAGLPAERPAVPTEARLVLLPATRVPTAPTETPVDLRIALTSDQTANYALARHDVQAPPPEVVAVRFGLPPARTSAEAARLDARPALRLAARSDSHHRIELALPGAHLDFPTDVRHASQEPRAASPERAVASGKPQVSKATPVSSARQRARPPAETPRVAAATAVKRVVSQRTVEDMLRDRILGN